VRNWKKIAEAEGFDIPLPQLERIGPVLDGLESAFRPLTANIPHQTQPAVAFRPVVETEDRP
jgi:hypothetical protein